MQLWLVGPGQNLDPMSHTILPCYAGSFCLEILLFKSQLERVGQTDKAVYREAAPPAEMIAGGQYPDILSQTLR